MASTTVTLKVTPQELQIIDSALRIYAYANDHLDRDVYKHPLEGFQHNLTVAQGQPKTAVRLASKLRQDIGLR